MNKQNGFSLIELMVIVAIIAFFLGLTIPRFLKYRTNQNSPAAPRQEVSSS